jgi:hypothetical protein
MPNTMLYFSYVLQNFHTKKYTYQMLFSLPLKMNIFRYLELARNMSEKYSFECVKFYTSWFFLRQVATGHFVDLTPLGIFLKEKIGKFMERKECNGEGKTSACQIPCFISAMFYKIFTKKSIQIKKILC